MTLHDHDSLDALLHRYRPPKADAALAERIITAAALREAPASKPSLKQIIGTLLKPAPAAALACCLILGLVAGQFVPQDAPPKPVASDNAADFLYYNGEIL